MKTLSILLCLIVPVVASADEPHDAIKPFLQTYCVHCHGSDKQKGDFRLDRLTELDSEMLQTIYGQVAGETMPPDDQPQPKSAERKQIAGHILDLAKNGSVVSAPGLRRLNKREYGNTVRDLLGLRKGTFDPGEYIYADEIDEGFDTNAESLVISNELLIEYMNAADKSLRQALFTADRKIPTPTVVEVKLKKMTGTSRRYINTDADYAVTRSGGKAQLFDSTASRVMTTPGRYTVTVTASGVDRDRYPVKLEPAEGPLIMGFGVQQEADASISQRGVLLKTFELKDDIQQTFTFDTWIDKGHFPYLSFVNGSSKPITQIRSNIRRRKLDASAMREPFVGPGIKISKFRIEGPLHDEWPPESFVATYGSREIPDLEDRTARESVVRRFASRAFRRPVAAQELAPYIDFLNKNDSATNDWHESLIRTFAAIMSSTDFLYLQEDPGSLEPFALASRLSYFFWSTMPDRELFSLAMSGQLKNPTVLQQQIQRMLEDPRSKQFSKGFGDQWLSLQKLGNMPPDGKGEFREYYRQNLEPAMLEETRRYFNHVLQDNRSVRDFIDSDYTFVNQALANLYEIPFDGEDADEFQRVTFSATAKRGGLLGHGSILTLSANGVETSPIERGVWVLASFLGTPPPPPPKEVPALTPDLNGALTIRDMLEKHRSDTACMECHRRMDPLGFALEAYDPIGRFRTKYSATQTISTHGNYLGKEFAEITELKQILSSDIRPFARSLIIRVAEYAKGRKLVAADYATVESIVERAAKNDYKFKDMILSIAASNLMTER